MKVDLHIHSTASDGSYTPKQIVQLALSKRMRVIALTDHDTLGGLGEAETEAKKWGLEFVKGIEISTHWKDMEVHILGYFLNLEDEHFVKTIETFKNLRTERNKKILALLQKYDIMIHIDVLEKKYSKQSIGRVHIAKEIVKQGRAKDIPEAFSVYLAQEGLAYVPKEGLTPKMAVDLLRKNSAFSSLAHPKLISKNENDILFLVEDLKIHGLNAIEANYPGLQSYEIRKYRSWAKKYDLEITGGSDFHGANRKNAEIGMQGIDYSQFEKFRR